MKKKNSQSYLTYVTESITRRADLRGSPRYTAGADRRCSLAFYEAGASIHLPGTLVDVSQWGARLVLETRLRPAGEVWFAFPGPEPHEWLPARVVRAVGSFWKRRVVVQIQFREPCPYAAFKQAVGGFQGC